MQLIFFTKFLKALRVEEIGTTAKKLGFDGLDLAVRTGHSVNPGNVSQALPAAMAVWQDMGLTVPMVTLEATPTNPEDAEVRAIFETCGRVGIPNIKLGYWQWTPQQHYWNEVETIRKAITRCAEMGRSYGVRSLVHTHSGNCYGVNTSAVMHLIHGFDTRTIGAYLDFAHLSVCGEPPAMALDIARDYLAMVGVKNMCYRPNPEGKGWRRELTSLADGLVNWPDVIRLLRQVGYDGPLSLHGEYSDPEDTPAILERVARDVNYLRECMA